MESVTISQKDWQKIVFELFRQDKKIEELEASRSLQGDEIFRLRTLVTWERNRNDQQKQYLDLQTRRLQISEEARQSLHRQRYNERWRILHWFEAQRFMPMLMLTGRAISNRIRKEVPVSE